MIYEEAKEKVLNVFYNWPKEKQVPYVIESVKSVHEIEIFPMSEFKSFCESHFYGDFQEVAMVMQRSANDCMIFDKADDWFVWYKENRTLESAAEPTDFALGEDELFKSLANSRDLVLMGFSYEDVRDILEAVMREKLLDGQEYKIVLGDEKGLHREVYGASAVTINRKHKYDGTTLMENAFLDKLLSLAISVELTDGYKRVMWMGQYANGMAGQSIKDKENSPYYLKVKQNVPYDVEIPDYEKIWGMESDNNLPMEDFLELRWKNQFLVNKDKKEYVDLGKYIHRSLYQKDIKLVVINPMVILTAVGNDEFVGDYHGTDMNMVGAWAWNLIGLKEEVPMGYTEITPTFIETERE